MCERGEFGWYSSGELPRAPGGELWALAFMSIGRFQEPVTRLDAGPGLE